MKRCLIIVCILILGHASGARAAGSGADTGNDLVRICHLAVRLMDGDRGLTPSQGMDGQMCLGYVGGFSDGLIFLPNPRVAATICPPHDSTWGQSVRVLSKWLDEHPAKLNEQWPALIFQAFHDAWPCKTKN